MLKKVRIFLCAVLIVATLTSCGGEKGTLAIPKNHACYDISVEESVSRFPISKAVNCTLSHNAETYLIGTWPSNEAPSSLSQTLVHDLAESICLPSNLPPNSTLNFWAYFVPTAKDWKNGAHWIRCDAMNQFSDKRGNKVFISWKGSIFKAGNLLPKGEIAFIYIEPAGDECFGSGNLSEGNSVALYPFDSRGDLLSQTPLGTSTLYSREGGCALGAVFEMRSANHPRLATLYDLTSEVVIGTVELTIDGNTKIYASAK